MATYRSQAKFLSATGSGDGTTLGGTARVARHVPIPVDRVVLRQAAPSVGRLGIESRCARCHGHPSPFLLCVMDGWVHPHHWLRSVGVGERAWFVFRDHGEFEFCAIFAHLWVYGSRFPLCASTHSLSFTQSLAFLTSLALFVVVGLSHLRSCGHEPAILDLGLCFCCLLILEVFVMAGKREGTGHTPTPQNK